MIPMKNIIINSIRFLLVVPLIFLFSCEDEDSIRIPEVEKATNFRIVRDVGSFDSTDPEAAVTLTMYSESNNISKVDMYVSHFSLTANAESDQFLLTTIQGSQITNDGTTEYSFGLNDLATPVGISASDLAGGDALNIYSIVTLTDGRVFPDTVRATADQEFLNVTPNIVNNSATTSFSPKLIFPIICEIDETFGTGTYLFEIVEGENIGFGIPIFDTGVPVEITATSSTGRTFEVGYFTGFGFTTNINFDFACNIILVGVTASGLGCTGTLAWDINAADPGVFDINDDSEFTISILHNTLNDCGLPVSDPYVFRLTKL